MVIQTDYTEWSVMAFKLITQITDYRALPGLLNQDILARNKDIHMLRMTNGDVEKVRKIIRGQRTKLGGQ